MTKKEAQSEIITHENRINELKKIIETPEKPSVMDRIKSYEDACVACEITPLTLDSFSMLPDGDRESGFAHHQLTVIARALNENHKFDWTNTNEYKYYPWFDYKSGVGFSFDVYVYWRAFTIVGSRLCFKSRELAEFAGRTFEKIYQKLMQQ